MATQAQKLAKLTPEAALLVAGVVTALGDKVTSGTVMHIASYTTAAIAGVVTSLRAPKAKKTVKAVAKKVKPAKPAPAAIRLPAFGLDWSYATLTPKQLQAAGVKFVCRYLSPDPGKNLSLKESAALGKAGIKRIVVWESTANRALEGITAGAQDAHAALEQANALKMPATAPIYFAIDFEAAGPDVEAYFQGVAGVLGHSRTGAYGGYAALAYLLNKHAIAYVWQTYAWSRGKWVPGAHLLQYDNGREISGQQVDFDHALTADCGWW
jgi:hypothetical protein